MSSNADDLEDDKNSGLSQQNSSVQKEFEEFHDEKMDVPTKNVFKEDISTKEKHRNNGLSTFSYSDFIYNKGETKVDSESKYPTGNNSKQESTIFSVDNLLAGKIKNSREAARLLKNPMLVKNKDNNESKHVFMPFSKSPYCIFRDHPDIEDNTLQFLDNYDLQKSSLYIPNDGYDIDVEKLYDSKNIKELFCTGSLLWNLTENEEEEEEDDENLDAGSNKKKGKRSSKRERVREELESLEFDDSYEKERLEKSRKIAELNEKSQIGDTNSISPGQYVCLTLTLPIVPELWIQKKKYKKIATKEINHDINDENMDNGIGGSEGEEIVNDKESISKDEMYEEDDLEEEEEEYGEEEEEEEEYSDYDQDEENERSNKGENSSYENRKEYDRSHNNLGTRNNMESKIKNNQFGSQEQPYKIVYDNSPLLVCVDNNNEHSNTFLNCRIKRHRWYKGLLKSNDPLIVSCGWRRYQTIPIYSMKDTTSSALTKNISENMNTNVSLGGIRYRMLKYTPEHLHCIMTTFGYVVPPNSGIMAFSGLNETRNFRVCATGTVLETTTKPKISKKLKLVGYPKEIKNKTAIIEKMFHSKAEAILFVNSKIRTVSGIRGIIKKAYKDGTIRCSFEDKILKSDIVFIRGFVPVKLHKYVNHVINHLVPLKKWPHLRRIVEIRAANNIPVYTNPDSIYAPEAERKVHKIEAINIPEKILNSLPFKSRNKIREIVSKPKVYTLLKGSEIQEKRLENQLYIVNQSERNRREAKKMERQKRQEKRRKIEEAKVNEAHKRKMKQRMRAQKGKSGM